MLMETMSKSVFVKSVAAMMRGDLSSLKTMTDTDLEVLSSWMKSWAAPSRGIDPVDAKMAEALSVIGINVRLAPAPTGGWVRSGGCKTTVSAESAARLLKLIINEQNDRAMN